MHLDNISQTRPTTASTRSASSFIADLAQSLKSGQMTLIKILAGSSLLTTLATNPFPALADARLMLLAVGNSVNSDPEPPLQYGLPIQSKDLRDI